jgi:curved DNA-binding protein
MFSHRTIRARKPQRNTLWTATEFSPILTLVFVDFYEALQISPNADQETIHRVYRLQAQRFHPDNQETGNASTFRSISDAYQILSDPQKRADYDAVHRNSRHQTNRDQFDQSTGTTTLADEHRKRHEILTILYKKRLSQPDQPAMGLRDLLDLVGMQREQLEFSLWYLKEGGYLLRTDSARHSITLKGVELIETLATHRDQPLKIDDSRVA